MDSANCKAYSYNAAGSSYQKFSHYNLDAEEKLDNKCKARQGIDLEEYTEVNHMIHFYPLTENHTADEPLDLSLPSPKDAKISKIRFNGEPLSHAVFL